MMTEDRSMERFDPMRKTYNAPPETPRDEMWAAIEAELDRPAPTEVLDTLREEYRGPPDAPRDEMWTVIQAKLTAEKAVTGDVVSLDDVRKKRRNRALAGRWQWAALATAAAAVLALGVGLGRMSVVPSDAPVEVATADEPVGAQGSFRAAAVSHLTRAESVLTLVSSDARSGRVDAEVSQWGRTLLLQTRLLLDSPAAEDPMIRRLLEDLEVVLIQVARLTPGRFEGSAQGDELDLLTEGLDNNDMMLRIRSAIPTGAVQTGI